MSIGLNRVDPIEVLQESAAGEVANLLIKREEEMDRLHCYVVYV